MSTCNEGQTVSDFVVEGHCDLRLATPHEFKYRFHTNQIG